jgi:leader peptidase (prepilin peptidase) / N-methyltransferase
VVWLMRIFGSYAFGREAMGLGDVHLMFGVGAVLGGGAATIAFFIAPFFGIIVGIYMLMTRSRRQLQYGPYLALATALVILFYCPIADQLRPGVMALLSLLRQATGG